MKNALHNTECKRNNAMPDGRIKCLFLGDSYTAGTAVPEELRWPVRLTALMNRSGQEVEPPRIIAGNGWTTEDLMNALDAADPAPQYDFAFLLIGVNNQFHGRPLPEFESHFDELVRRTIRLVRGRSDRVIVISVPDYSVTPFAAERDPAKIASEIDLFNDACERIAAQRKVRFLDLVEISRQAATNRELLVSDGLHPSGEMYRLWSDFVFGRLSEPS
jgi:lysophospholipase L1-like esterase